MPPVSSSFGPSSRPGIIGRGMRASRDTGFGEPGRGAARGDCIPLGNWSSTLPTCLPEEKYEGSIGGIVIKWTPAAVSRLPSDAKNYELDDVALKAATEIVAYTSAQQRSQTGAVILYVLIHVLNNQY